MKISGEKYVLKITKLDLKLTGGKFEPLVNSWTSPRTFPSMIYSKNFEIFCQILSKIVFVFVEREFKMVRRKCVDPAKRCPFFQNMERAPRMKLQK